MVTVQLAKNMGMQQDIVLNLPISTVTVQRDDDVQLRGRRLITETPTDEVRVLLYFVLALEPDCHLSEFILPI